jgi:hypothetical protein
MLRAGAVDKTLPTARSLAPRSKSAGFRDKNLPVALWHFAAKHAVGLDPWVDSGSRKENASKQKPGALSALIQPEPKGL